MSDHEIRPVKTQKLKAAPQQPLNDPVPTVDERLETMSAALETALDPDAKPKDRTDMLTRLRDARAKRDTSSGTTP